MLQAIGFDPESNLRRLVAGLVVEAHQLIGAEREGCVGLTGVVAELYLVHVRRKTLHNGTDLSPQQSALGDIL
jgi:hypothetical protein